MTGLSGITVLGDGLSDQGMFGRMTGGAYPPSPPFHEGRWTGGPTWVELLAEGLGVALDDADNLAQGGATTGWFNINEPLRGALGLPDDAPIRGVLAQAQALLADSPALDPERLYVIWAGGHDFGSYLESGFPDVVAEPPADNIGAAGTRLLEAGARRFLMGLMPSLADTPAYRGTKHEQAARDLVDAYNGGLQGVAERLRAAGAMVILLDAQPAFLTVALEPAAHGVTEISEPYLPMDYIEFSDPLAPAKPLPADRVGRRPDEFLTFWAVSAGPAVHQEIARLAAAAVIDALDDNMA
jgi:phospholipase/lecithinase/hemolysin